RMSIVSSSRKKYTPEYRQEAARLVLESGRPIAHVAKEIGVAEGLLGKWVKLERERQGSDDGRSDADIRAENARLRRELAEAKMDNEFLSKATAFFAAKQRDRKNLSRSEEHTSELQSRFDIVCRLLLEKKNKTQIT